MVRSGRLVRDVGTSIREVVKKLPSDDMLTDEQWNHMNEAWCSVKEAAQPVIATKPYVADYFSVVSGTTLSTISTVYAISPVTLALQPVVNAAKAQLASIANATARMDDVRNSMMRLGLNVRVAQRSALELLEDAKLALDQPQTRNADGALPVLIAVREAILSALDQLIKRRPKQEAVGKTQEKVKSLGNQCGRTSLQSSFFDRLGTDGADLLNRLSGKKQATMPRSEIMTLFDEGLLFLRTFLEALDETKLRPF
jgi:hypothetical protein